MRYFRDYRLPETLSPPRRPRGPELPISIQALADLGYRVDITRADPYALPMDTLSKPVAAHRPLVPSG